MQASYAIIIMAPAQAPSVDLMQVENTPGDDQVVRILF